MRSTNARATGLNNIVAIVRERIRSSSHSSPAPPILRASLRPLPRLPLLLALPHPSVRLLLVRGRREDPRQDHPRPERVRRVRRHDERDEPEPIADERGRDEQEHRDVYHVVVVRRRPSEGQVRARVDEDAVAVVRRRSDVREGSVAEPRRGGGDREEGVD
eukprot:8166-Pelagococcus_subviridis.AAC.2